MIKKVWQFLSPPPSWRLPVIALLTAFVSIGLYTAIISNAVSYMTDDPKACINCHVMTPQYQTWKHSSHREVAHCNDCHVPQDSEFKKYAFKAMDGLYHSYVFTTRGEPQVIKAREASVNVIQSNCIRCHQDQVTDAKTEFFVAEHAEARTSRLCWDCHKEVPHGKTKSLSATRYLLEKTVNTVDDHNIIPQWLEKQLNTEK